MQETLIAVPCYNERRRLRPDAFLWLARQPNVKILFIDDGSRDLTVESLRDICTRSKGQAAWIELGRNQGKAEAVRVGMLSGIADGTSIVGFLDADLSTPPEEALRLLSALQLPNVQVALGARVRLLGAHIDRRRARHILGRLFATVASLALQLPVYDTQCGAKFFRNTGALRHALRKPFASRWAFDVELIARLLEGGPGVPGLLPEDFIEVPLRSWSDVSGSKLNAPASLRAGLDILSLGLRRAGRIVLEKAFPTSSSHSQP